MRAEYNGGMEMGIFRWNGTLNSIHRAEPEVEYPSAPQG